MSAAASGAAFDVVADLTDEDVAAARLWKYHVSIAAEASNAVSKIEAQIEGLRQTLATKRAEVEQHSAICTELGRVA